MKNCLFVGVLLALLLPACDVPSSSLEIFVSPEGSDANSGTLEEPLQTFAAAKKRVSSVLEDFSEITVYFRNGEYLFDQTEIIGPTDCAENVNITYSAYKDEKPVFTSGIKLDPWKKIGDDDPNYAYLPDKAKDHVFLTGFPAGIENINFLADKQSEWLELGKLNVTRYVTTEKFIHGHSVEGQMWDPPEEKRIAQFSQSMEGLSNVDSALHFTIYTADFELQLVPVKEITGNTLITATPAGHRLALPEEGQRHESDDLAHIHNLVEGINGPGIFAVYPAIRKIYLWPAGSIDEIYASTLNELIRVEGLPKDEEAWFTKEDDQPIQHINFDGITFTNATMPIWLTGDNSAQHDWAMLDKDNALLRFRGAENCAVRNCVFEKSGGAGLAFDLYAKHNIIENNTFRYLGYEGVRIAGYGIGQKDENKYNTVRKNEFHHVNSIHQYGAALVLWNTGFNTVTDNFFHHFASRAILFSAPRSRAFTRNNQELFPPDRRMREQAWNMARWFEIPDSALATVYYAMEEEEDEVWKIRRVEVNGHRQGSRGGLIADRVCSYFRYLRGNTVERNVIGYGAEALFADGIFYITGCASGEPNRIRHNYIYNTGVDLPRPNIPFRLIYIDGYTGDFEFTQNFAYNCRFRFEVTAMYNWWGEVESHANIFYNVEGEEYGEGNLCLNYGNHDPREEDIDSYKEMVELLSSGQLAGPETLPGANDIVATLNQTISDLE